MGYISENLDPPDDCFRCECCSHYHNGVCSKCDDDGNDLPDVDVDAEGWCDDFDFNEDYSYDNEAAMADACECKAGEGPND